MSRLDDALEILEDLGLPKQQRQERSALTLLALAHLSPKSKWSSASQPLLRTVDIMAFIREKHGKDYKPNSRETFRRQTLHQFEQARIVDRNPDDPTRPTNSGKNCYGLTNEALVVLHSYGTPSYTDKVAEFLEAHGSLQAAYNKIREQNQVPLQLPDGQIAYLSAGKHNELQAAIIEQMGPRFTPGALVLYVGDTAQKHVVCDTQRLAALSLEINQHDKLPDVVLFQEEKNWLILVEAVTSHGPVNPKRYNELEDLLSKSNADRIYITAFLDRAEFRKYASDIAWETEVWIAENPGHMIHFNGPKFLGPYKPNDD